MTEEDRIVVTSAAMREMLEDAAEQGARRTLARLGLEDEQGVKDLREVRDLLSAWRTARKVAWETVVRAGTMFMLGALALGIAMSWIGDRNGR